MGDHLGTADRQGGFPFYFITPHPLLYVLTLMQSALFDMLNLKFLNSSQINPKIFCVFEQLWILNAFFGGIFSNW